MNDDTDIRKASVLITDLVSVLKDLLNGSRIDLTYDHTKYLAASCAYTIRQVQAICLLANYEVPLYYAQQAEQLVRGLCEIWARVSWMMDPVDTEERENRLWRIYKNALDNLSRICEYQLCKGMDPSILAGTVESYQEKIKQFEANLDKPLAKLPNSRSIYEELKRPDLYVIFRYESGPVHASALAVSSMLTAIEGENYILGGPSNYSWVKILMATLELLKSTSVVIIKGLNLDLEKWKKVEKRTTSEFQALIHPLDKRYAEQLHSDPIKMIYCRTRHTKW